MLLIIVISLYIYFLILLKLECKPLQQEGICDMFLNHDLTLLFVGTSDGNIMVNFK